MLPLFAFTADEIAAKANLATDIVERVLEAFELPSTERNEGFNALHDFNVITAMPLLRTPNGEFLSLQTYSLAEAIYEAPHHWMDQDEGLRYAELHRFGAGFHPTETPQEFESFRTDPQEPSPAPMARCQAIDFQPNA